MTTTRPPAPLETETVAVLCSVQDAAALLDPPCTPDQVRALVALANLAPVRAPAGTGAPRGRGRPPVLYRAAELQRAHARAVRAGLLALLPPPVDAVASLTAAGAAR
ncbi:MAG TPA: hypothetical protein VGL93_10425 [Streptosporangiaceae bacterium]|jgi:hypothetical protein